MGGTTPVHHLRYPDLSDPADITQVKTLALDTDAALQAVATARSQSRTYEKAFTTYFYVPNNWIDVPGSPLAVAVGSTGAVYLAVASFDIRNVYNAYGLVSGYLALDGVAFTDEVQRANAAQPTPNSRITVSQSWAGQLAAGNHQFSLKMTSDHPGGYAHHGSKLTVTIIQ